MGGWKLEVARMAIYMTFPVVIFHYFNQPQYYEETVARIKKEWFPPVSEEYTENFQEKLNKIREKRELEELKNLIEKHK